MDSTDHTIAKLLRRLADYVEDNGVSATLDLLLPKPASLPQPTKANPPQPPVPPPVALQPAPAPHSPPETTPRSKAPLTNAAGKRLIPLSHWPQYHDWPPLGGLRHLVFNSRYNGFDKVVRRVGRRVLIDEEAFFEWVEKEGGKPWSVEPVRRRKK